ncbi:pre-mRNA splicing factor, putative [Bodo saltans]|uniref:RNA helicase n=1 Tax=Bodo saltans TaxID=75058 RepID=A0A0S4ITR4_BODSA|nr:pre-mRNA splicing factor, putative [Bodo saltans]|eukprot:CUF82437.1 pre-mRNA splicing factor, putative [Bodo saltans]
MEDHTERTASSDDYDMLLTEHFQHRGGRHASNNKQQTSAPASTTGAPEISLEVHKEVRPSFLSNAPAGAFSRQIDIIVPVTKATDSLPKAAEKGSAVLLEHKREQERARAARDKVDLKKSDLHALVGAGGIIAASDINDDDDDSGPQGGRREGKRPRGAGAPTTSGTSSGHEDQLEADKRELESLRNKLHLLERSHGGGSSNNVPTSTSIGATAPGKTPTTTAAQAARLERRTDLNAAEAVYREKVKSYDDSSMLDFLSARSLPLTGSSSSHTNSEKQRFLDHREFIRKTRESLPIYFCRSELLRYIGENSVSIIMGETGSGKTTQLVQYLYEVGYASGGKQIGCTQPRRLAAIGVSTRVAEEVGCTLGTTVGYSIHLDDMTTEQTKIRFMTDGVLLREVVNDPFLEKYSVIVMDEAHERSMDTDVLLGVLKGICRRRSDLKVIVTSATMNIMKFSAFFNNAPYYEIPGKTFDVELEYASTPVEDYVHAAVIKAMEIHVRATLDSEKQHSDTTTTTTGTTPPPTDDNGGDILIFMTGRDDVYGACALLKQRLHSMRRPSGEHWDETLLIIPCMSEAVQNSAASAVLFDPAPPGMRKCIISTNVAETSLTIHGIRYVIDCGMMKTNVFHPTFGMNTLKRYPTSKAQSNQRKGRAGRTAKGTCFRLFTREQFTNEMLPATIPEIQRSSVDTVVLLLKSIGVRDLSGFDFIDAPPEANMRSSLWQLWLFGALDDAGDITESGRCMLEFPVNPTLANILIHSTRLKCSAEVLSIVAMLSADVKSLFEMPAGKEEDARQAHGRFANGESDHLTYLNVYQQYQQPGAGGGRQWAREHFLNVTVLERAIHVREQLVEKMQRLKLDIASAGDGETDVIRRCLVHGYSLQAARKVAGKWSEYQSLLNVGVTCHVVPSSSILNAGTVPEYIIYDDLMFTTKEYFVTVTAVDPAWLVAVGRGLYTINGGGSGAAVDMGGSGDEWAVTLSSSCNAAKELRAERAAASRLASENFAHQGQLGSSMFDELLRQDVVIVPAAQKTSSVLPLSSPVTTTTASVSAASMPPNPTTAAKRPPPPPLNRRRAGL